MLSLENMSISALQAMTKTQTTSYSWIDIYIYKIHIMIIEETITFVCLYYIFVKYACIYLMMPCIWTERNKEYCIVLYCIVLIGYCLRSDIYLGKD